MLSRCTNIRSVEGTREAVIHLNEKTIDRVELGDEIASKVNHGFATSIEETEEDEDDDPCVSDPSLPECKEDGGDEEGNSSKTI